MIKPIWAIAGVALLGTAGIAGALVVASPGGEEEVVQEFATASPDVIMASHAAVEASPGAIPLPFAAPTERPVPKPLEVSCNSNRENTVGGQVFRWGDLMLGVPNGSPVVVGRGDPNLVELIVPGQAGEPQSNILIDSKNGETKSDDVQAKHRADIEGILETKTFCPFDLATAPWPYASTRPANLAEETLGGFAFIAPDPASGVAISWGVSEGGTGHFLEVRNHRSHMFIYEHRAVQFTPGTIHPEDQEAFNRFAQSVRKCDPETPC